MRNGLALTKSGYVGESKRRKTAAELFNKDRPFNDASGDGKTGQSFEYYEALAHEDFERNQAEAIERAHEIREAYGRPSQEALDLAERAHRAICGGCERCLAAPRARRRASG
jgi:hypothetical protein